MTEFKEQFRLNLSNEGKIRNRCEAHMVKYAQELLAQPVPMTIGQVRMNLCLHLDAYKDANPTHGTCRLSNPSTASRIMQHPHHVTRSFGIYGRGRAIYPLSIAETVRKDANNNYEPLLPLRS